MSGDAMLKMVPSPPQGPGGPRPQTHRYVRDSVLRLGEDAQHSGCYAAGPIGALGQPRPQSRAESRAAASTTPSTKSGGDAATCGACSCCAGMWKRTFHEEAMECVEAMRAVVEGASLRHFGSRFEDWRKVDMKATAQLQHHVKELARINTCTEQFLLECHSAADLIGFREALQTMLQRSGDLAAAREALAGTADAIAERASEKVVEQWRGDVNAYAQKLHMHAEEQTLQWCGQAVQWTRLNQRVDKLHGAVEGLTEAMSSQSKQLGDLDASHHQARQRSETVLADLAKAIQESSLATVEKHAAEVRKGLSEDVGSLWNQLENFFSQDGKAGKQLGELEESVRGLRAVAEVEKGELRGKLDSLGKQAAVLEEEAERGQELKIKVNSAKKEMSAMNGRIKELDSELEQKGSELKSALESSVSNGLRRLREVEDRGNLRMDRATGEVKCAAPLEFVVCKPSAEPPPDPELVNPEAAGKIFADLAELAGIFEGPVQCDVQVLVGKGGTPAFWEQLAEGRATLIRKKLEKLGLSASRLTVAGQTIKGKGALGLILRLDRSLFKVPEPASPKANAGAAGKRAPSPRGK